MSGFANAAFYVRLCREVDAELDRLAGINTRDEPAMAHMARRFLIARLEDLKRDIDGICDAAPVLDALVADAVPSRKP